MNPTRPGSVAPDGRTRRRRAGAERFLRARCACPGAWVKRGRYAATRSIVINDRLGAYRPPVGTGRVGRSSGVGVKSRTLLRGRLLTLLAGFFGFVMTAVLAAIPGTAVADVIRVGSGETANAAGTGGSAATVAALDRGSGRSRAAPAGTPHGPRRGASAFVRVVEAGAFAVPRGSAAADAIERPSFGTAAAHPVADRARAARTAAAHLVAGRARAGRTATAHLVADRVGAGRGTVASRFLAGDEPAADRAGPGSAVPAASLEHARASRRVAAVVAAHSVVPPAVLTTAVSLRGPPSHTGS
jgi:hypothetical protein